MRLDAPDINLNLQWPGCFLFFQPFTWFIFRNGVYRVASNYRGVVFFFPIILPPWISSQVEVAIKTLPLDKSKEEHIKAEIQHQLAMDHPNICRLLEAALAYGPTADVGGNGSWRWSMIHASPVQVRNLDLGILCFFLEILECQPILMN